MKAFIAFLMLSFGAVAYADSATDVVTTVLGGLSADGLETIKAVLTVIVNEVYDVNEAIAKYLDISVGALIDVLQALKDFLCNTAKSLFAALNAHTNNVFKPMTDAMVHLNSPLVDGALALSKQMSSGFFGLVVNYLKKISKFIINVLVNVKDQ